MSKKASVLFVCVHNAGRSQMAAGYLQALAFEFLPVPTLMSRDNIASMQAPNILPLNGVDALTKVFGISRRTLEGMK